MICNICGGGGNWLREFQHHMSDPDVWTWAMREVHDADTTAPYVRLPKIDKTNPTSWVPSTENVTTPGGHVTALANQEFYKAMIGHSAAPSCGGTLRSGCGHDHRPGW